jgi:hypothetical protein
MTDQKAVIEPDKMNIAQNKDLLGNLPSSLVAQIDTGKRQKLLNNVFLTESNVQSPQSKSDC